MLYESGEIYFGQWVNWMSEGIGVFIYNKDKNYCGDFKKGKKMEWVFVDILGGCIWGRMEGLSIWRIW